MVSREKKTPPTHFDVCSPLNQSLIFGLKMPFEYTRLEKGQFRLLEIRPATPLVSSAVSEPAALNCKLHVESLETKRPYKALSYVWGDTKDPAHINVDNTELPVTQNLFVALQHIRDELHPVTIWIDAVCIDQNNASEKIEQIKCMTSIYSASACTIVWLGPSTSSIDACIATCDGIGGELIKRTVVVTSRGNGAGEEEKNFEELLLESSSPSTEEIPGRYEYLEEKIEELLAEPLKDGKRDDTSILAFLTGFRDLMIRDYWGRVWIRQEFVVSSKILIQCGSATVGLDKFRVCLNYRTWLQKRRVFQMGNVIEEVQRIVPHNIAAKMREWMAAKRPGPELDQENEDYRIKFFKGVNRTLDKFADTYIGSSANTIFGLRKVYQDRLGDSTKGIILIHILAKVYINSQIGATDERDRIYAMRTMASDKEALNIKKNDDEEESVDKVYTDTARAIIAAGHVDLLSFAQHRSKDSSRESTSKLPSWVPDWRDLIVRPCNQLPWDSHFSASGRSGTPSPTPTPTLNSHSQDLKQLILPGWKIDTITQVRTRWTPTDDDFSTNISAIRTFLTEIQELCDLSNLICTSHNNEDDSQEIYTGEDPRFDRESAYYRIPVADQEQHGRLNLHRKATEASKEAYDVLFRNVAVAGKEGILGKERPYLNLMSYQQYRRPFLSVKGYVGLVPDVAEVGDVVVLFAGAKFPYVLRHNEDAEVNGDWNGTGNLGGTYSFIGEAYVHGIMSGEFVIDNRKSEMFVLKDRRADGY